MLELTDQNYYGVEADWEYMSCSQYEDFLACEAGALAKLQRRFEKEPTKAFLVGNYFHTALESQEAHEAFCKANFDEIFKTKTTKSRGTEITGKYADFERCDQMISTAVNDPKIRQLIDIPGQHELIMTGMLFDRYPWKIRMDKYIPQMRTIIDWKTVANITETQWNSEYGQKVSFIRNFKYVMRAAVYSEIEMQNTGKTELPCFLLVCISKQDPPDKDIFLMNHEQEYELELEEMKEHLGRIDRIKKGEEKPRRCGCCEYCRGTKQIRDIKGFYVLDPDKKPSPEYDYAVPEGLPDELSG